MYWTLFIVTLMLYWMWERLPGTPPMLPGEIPLIGHFHRLFTSDLFDFVKVVTKYCYERGGVIVGKIGPTTVYVVADPDDCYTVANTCLHKQYLYRTAKNWLGDGLLCARLSVWKQHRKLLNPAFNQQVLNNFLDVFNYQARKLVSDVAKEEGNGPFEHWHYIKRNSLESICCNKIISIFHTILHEIIYTFKVDDAIYKYDIHWLFSVTTMGTDIRKYSIALDDYAKAVDNLLSIYTRKFFKPWLFFENVYKMSDIKNEEDNTIKILHNFSNLVLQRRKAQRQVSEKNGDMEIEKSNTQFRPFIDLLLDAENTIFTEKEIREEVDNMILTGFDSTASTLSVILFHIGTHPEVQDRLIEEINAVFNSNESDVKKEDLHKLKYLEAVLKESMRLYPIAPVIGRWIDKKVKLKNYTLPANSQCILMLYGVNRHPIWGPDAEEFKPERWLSPTTLPKNPNAFMSFSIGKRNCFGKTYAMMSMKTSLVHFLRRYRIKADSTNTKFKLDVILKISTGGEISIKSRI